MAQYLRGGGSQTAERAHSRGPASPPPHEGKDGRERPNTARRRLNCTNRGKGAESQQIVGHSLLSNLQYPVPIKSSTKDLSLPTCGMVFQTKSLYDARPKPTAMRVASGGVNIDAFQHGF